MDLFICNEGCSLLFCYDIIYSRPEVRIPVCLLKDASTKRKMDPSVLFKIKALPDKTDNVQPEQEPIVILPDRLD